MWWIICKRIHPIVAIKYNHIAVFLKAWIGAFLVLLLNSINIVEINETGILYDGVAKKVIFPPFREQYVQDNLLFVKFLS